MINVKFPVLPSSSSAPFSATGQGFTTAGGGGDGLGKGVIFVSHVKNVGNVVAVGTLDAHGNFTDGLVWVSYAGEGTLSYLVMGGTASQNGSNLDVTDPHVDRALYADQDDEYRVKMSRG